MGMTQGGVAGVAACRIEALANDYAGQRGSNR